MTIYNFTMLNVPFANGAISAEIAPFPDWDRGLGIAFDQTEGKPEMKGLNGLFQVLTTSMLYLKQRGISEWDSALEYPANAFVTEGAKLYKSKRTNTAKRPSLSQLDWDVWASISDISVSTNGNLKKTVAADGSVTLEVPTASDSQRGSVRQATTAEVANGSNVNAYINPANVGQTFGASLSANGWCRLPNGLIMQWGSTGFIGESNKMHTSSFNTVFPTACLSVTVGTMTDRTSGVGAQRMAQLISSTRSGFTWFSDGFVESGYLISATYFAIGY